MKLRSSSTPPSPQCFSLRIFSLEVSDEVPTFDLALASSLFARDGIEVKNRR